MKYKTKPEYVDAWVWDETNTRLKEIGCGFMSKTGHEDRPNEAKNLTIRAVVGSASVLKGDYIVKDDKGVYYPLSPEVFEKTYECAE